MHEVTAKPIYDPITDSVKLIDKKGEVQVQLHRGMVIKMFGLLASNPPPVEHRDI